MELKDHQIKLLCKTLKYEKFLENSLNLQEFRKDLSRIMKIRDGVLENKYTFTPFKIRKRNGTLREIVAPDNNFKKDNKFVMQFLLNCKKIREKLPFYRLSIVKAYREVEKILTHSNSKIDRFIKIDISNAFNTTDIVKINYTLAKIIGPNFYLDFLEFIEAIITICTYNGTVPQGFPTSRLIFDLVFSSIDKKIYGLGINNYIRYIDDIIIMTNIPTIFSSIQDIIESVGFKTNKKKSKEVVIGDKKKEVHFLGGCVYHPNDNKCLRNKIKIRLKTRNRYRSYKHIANKYRVTESIAVSGSMKDYST